MKTLIKNSTNRFGLLVLLVASICWTGCEVFTRHSSPLVGWKADLNHEPNQDIVKDWQDYIQKLPYKSGFGPFFYFEDGTGQHAVDVEVDIKGQNASWHYAFIYDKENKRVKVVKYGYTRYQS